MGFHHLGPPAGNDAKLHDPGAFQPLDDVFQNGPPLHLEHGLGHLLGEVLHAGSLSGCQNDGFHVGRSKPQARGGRNAAVEKHDPFDDSGPGLLKKAMPPSNSGYSLRDQPPVPPPIRLNIDSSDDIAAGTDP